MLNICGSAPPERMVGLPGGDGSALLRKAYRDGWLCGDGSPTQVMCGAAKLWVPEALGDPLEREATDITQVSGEGQWQNGHCEARGRAWEGGSSTRSASSAQPAHSKGWQARAWWATDARNRLVQGSGVSPYQHVSGRDPSLAGDAPQRNPGVASAAAPLLRCGGSGARDPSCGTPRGFGGARQPRHPPGCGYAAAACARVPHR